MSRFARLFPLCAVIGMLRATFIFILTCNCAG